MVLWMGHHAFGDGGPSGVDPLIRHVVPAFWLAGPARFFQSLAGGFQYLVVGGVLAGFIDGFV